MRQIIRKGKLFFKTKDIVTFSLFLLLSSTFWFVNALSTQRKASLTMPISYTGIPAGVKITTPLPQHINLVIKDEGIKLFQYGKRKLTTLRLNLSEHFTSEDNSFEIKAKDIENLIAATLLPTTHLISFGPEEMNVQYVHLDWKKVAVRLRGSVETAHQHLFTAPTTITPDTIEILGAKAQIDTIDYVYTTRVDLINLKKSEQYIIDIDRTIQDIQYSQPTVMLHTSIERFTEKTLTLPINFINTPDTINIRTFPTEVNAVFNTPISSFKNISEKDIQVTFDYQAIDNSRRRTHKLKCTNMRPNLIHNLKIKPENIEFLLETK